MKLQAFDNDPQKKVDLLRMAAAHRIADEYKKGSYDSCSIGCCIRDVNLMNGTTLAKDDHKGLADQLGIPLFITRLQDRIFEGLEDNPNWTERLFSAIETGKDLTPVLPVFLLKTLDHLPEQKRADVVDSIKGVKEVLRNWIKIGKPDINKARDAATHAIYAAHAAHATHAAEAAAHAIYAATYAATHAAEAAADAATHAAEAATHAEHWEIIANDLIDSITEIQAKDSLEEK